MDVGSSSTWFLPGLLVSQLSEVVAATCIYGSIVQEEDGVSMAATHVPHFLPIEEVTFPWGDNDLIINSTQA